MQIDWWTLALQLINALILIWILSRFLFKPVAKVIADRQAAARKIVEEAEALKQAAEADRTAIAAERSNLAAEHERLLAASRQDADEARQSLVAKAEAEIEDMRSAAASIIDRQKQEAAKEVSRQATQLAVAIARRLVSRLPDASKVTGFAEGLAKAIAELPETTRADLAGMDAPLRLHVARPLTEEETAAITAAIGEVLGHAPALDPVVDPDVIAGLEVEAQHAVIRNSLRGDLDRILAEFQDQEAETR
ncbi:F-type ATPase subunit b [Hartmannibacter diazotrophicus]|uniref:ATP synthase subunit b n=1 Tax=Hartmannibacter diazotrophicus TaxID=1482074 RepID=A0A2C9D5X3_9HYPH|nr:F0F1 ATP synthase subunit delta [Hartmannibacter diazotrophicus]SON55131.1 F-type ATPase subunit b [Hartmannibacter diazotrophicus]